jgi:hypothetical protein
MSHDQTMSAMHPLSGRETILLVDDEIAVLKLGRAILEHQGYRVLLAPDGQEALTIYGEHDNEIAVVILDMMMPNLNGLQTLRQLKQLNPAVKVLMTTGSYSDELEDSALAEGVEAVLQKPYSLDELVRVVERMLAHEPPASTPYVVSSETRTKTAVGTHGRDGS